MTAPNDNGPAHESDARTMLIDERFTGLASKFFGMFRRKSQGGGALAVYLNGKPVLDVWSGWADRDRPWRADSMALSYSTGKGVAATVAHRLIDRGLLDVDAPVADYWSEFAANGKADITLRDVLNHRAGLQRIRGLLPDPHDFLDHDAVSAAMAASAPDPLRLRASGYHAITFGTLVAEIAQRATGRDFTDLVRSELAEPLGERDFFYGVPQHERHRLATLSPRIGVARVPFDRLIAPFAPLQLVYAARGAVYDGWADMSIGTRPYDAMMPGWNGVFTARALAKMYGAIANDGMVSGRRLLRAETTQRIAEMPPNGRFDYVLGASPHFALGYHRAIVGPRITRRALGHFGIGGSGGIAFPELGLAVGFVTNHLGNHAMSVGDARLPMLAARAERIARAVLGRAPIPVESEAAAS
ncbi:serine hydrolase domain-containing protein [Nocardia bhagyanarayanae]|uniref:CubicO group peptidase (Beta-lactamase class C family) n=1 Tax=Nocardia bhagyanarayanae TaxID=1215925 RepID=A0A543EVH6_9NOCA|nr:serine hydrolase domain-containing protein [Nocardia bhagyanarayanae]TQM25555.1 CubicO group peptidase (beta-lactamase class C family) [Nocardia bhagyanarayanae]